MSRLFAHPSLCCVCARLLDDEKATRTCGTAGCQQRLHEACAHVFGGRCAWHQAGREDSRQSRTLGRLGQDVVPLPSGVNPHAMVSPPGHAPVEFASPSVRALCDVCLSTGGIVVRCGCGVTVHRHCVGDTSSGAYTCEACRQGVARAQRRCALCPRQDGAVTWVADGRVVHVVCAVYHRLAFATRRGLVSGLETLDQESPDSVPCDLCGLENGVVLACQETGCAARFHASCVHAALQTSPSDAGVVLVGDPAQSGALGTWALYCRQHHSQAFKAAERLKQLRLKLARHVDSRFNVQGMPAWSGQVQVPLPFRVAAPSSLATGGTCALREPPVAPSATPSATPSHVSDGAAFVARVEALSQKNALASLSEQQKLLLRESLWATQLEEYCGPLDESAVLPLRLAEASVESDTHANLRLSARVDPAYCVPSPLAHVDASEVALLERWQLAQVPQKEWPKRLQELALVLTPDSLSETRARVCLALSLSVRADEECRGARVICVRPLMRQDRADVRPPCGLASAWMQKIREFDNGTRKLLPPLREGETEHAHVLSLRTQAEWQHARAVLQHYVTLVERQWGGMTRVEFDLPQEDLMEARVLWRLALCHVTRAQAASYAGSDLRQQDFVHCRGERPKTRRHAPPSPPSSARTLRTVLRFRGRSVLTSLHVPVTVSPARRTVSPVTVQTVRQVLPVSHVALRRARDTVTGDHTDQTVTVTDQTVTDQTVTDQTVIDQTVMTDGDGLIGDGLIGDGLIGGGEHVPSGDDEVLRELLAAQQLLRQVALRNDLRKRRLQRRLRRQERRLHWRNAQFRVSRTSSFLCEMGHLYTRWHLVRKCLLRGLRAPCDPDAVTCGVCGDGVCEGGERNVLVKCEDCEVNAHMFCVGLSEQPDAWQCDACAWLSQRADAMATQVRARKQRPEEPAQPRCALCTRPGGVLKPLLPTMTAQHKLTRVLCGPMAMDAVSPLAPSTDAAAPVPSGISVTNGSTEPQQHTTQQHVATTPLLSAQQAQHAQQRWVHIWCALLHHCMSPADTSSMSGFACQQPQARMLLAAHTAPGTQHGAMSCVHCGDCRGILLVRGDRSPRLVRPQEPALQYAHARCEFIHRPGSLLARQESDRRLQVCLPAGSPASEHTRVDEENAVLRRRRQHVRARLDAAMRTVLSAQRRERRHSDQYDARRCAVCFEGTSRLPDEFLVQCAACNVVVHRSCYGVTLKDARDVQDFVKALDHWRCARCRQPPTRQRRTFREEASMSSPACTLCWRRGGAMRRVHVPPASAPSHVQDLLVSEWAHVHCAFWLPGPRLVRRTERHEARRHSALQEATASHHAQATALAATFTVSSSDLEAETAAVAFVDSLHKIPLACTQVLCSLCEKPGGACVQCCRRGCGRCFHVTCALFAGCFLRVAKSHGRFARLIFCVDCGPRGSRSSLKEERSLNKKEKRSLNKMLNELRQARLAARELLAQDESQAPVCVEGDTELEHSVQLLRRWRHARPHFSPRPLSEADLAKVTAWPPVRTARVAAERWYRATWARASTHNTRRALVRHLTRDTREQRPHVRVSGAMGHLTVRVTRAKSPSDHSVDHSSDHSVDHSVDHSTDHSVDHSVDRSVDRSDGDSTTESDRARVVARVIASLPPVPPLPPPRVPKKPKLTLKRRRRAKREVVATADGVGVPRVSVAARVTDTVSVVTADTGVGVGETVGDTVAVTAKPSLETVVETKTISVAADKDAEETKRRRVCWPIQEPLPSDLTRMLTVIGTHRRKEARWVSSEVYRRPRETAPLLRPCDVLHLQGRAAHVVGARWRGGWKPAQTPDWKLHQDTPPEIEYKLHYHNANQHLDVWLTAHEAAAINRRFCDLCDGNDAYARLLREESDFIPIPLVVDRERWELENALELSTLPASKLKKLRPNAKLDELLQLLEQKRHLLPPEVLNRAISSAAGGDDATDKTAADKKSKKAKKQKQATLSDRGQKTQHKKRADDDEFDDEFDDDDDEVEGEEELERALNEDDAAMAD